MTQEQYTQNRFGYLEQLDDEALMTELEETKEEIARCEDALYDGTASGEELSEIRNSDLPYAEDKLDYLNMIAGKRGLIKTK